MKIVKRVYPYIDEHGKERYDLDHHYGVEIDELGNEIARYKIKQIETGVIYDEAVDLMPCRYTYECLDEVIEQGEQEQENSENIAELQSLSAN